MPTVPEDSRLAAPVSDSGVPGRPLLERPRQLTLFPVARPFVERFGRRLFQCAPRRPGVYVMSDALGRPLYVGQSSNLHARLGTYRAVRLDRCAPKLRRLALEARSLTWEICPSATEARLRENELLRLHRPPFNVVNARTFLYRYWHVGMRDCAVDLRLTSSSTPEPGLTVYGAFKGGLARRGFASLLRVLWAAQNRPTGVYDLPSRLVLARPPTSYRLALGGGPAEALWSHLGSFLAGLDPALLRALRESLSGLGMEPFLRTWLERDLGELEAFFASGPARNRQLRERFDIADSWIDRSEIDDLAVLDQEKTHSPQS